ncbi:MAG: Ig-like domain-containing protein, partial [Patescibacteria group bacterium]
MRSPGRFSPIVFAYILAVGLFSFQIAFAADGSGTASVSVSPSTTLVNSTTNTLTFTFTAAETMNSGGISISVPSTWSTPQGSSGTAGYTTVSTNGTVGNVFDEADTVSGWTGDACSGGLTLDTAFKHSGTGSIQCINNNEGTHDVWYKTGTAQDWSSYTTVGFWIYTDTSFTNSQLKFEYNTGTNLTSVANVEELGFGATIPANTWTYVSFSFVTAPSTRTAIKTYGFEVANASVKSAVIHLDAFAVGAGSSFVPTFNGRDIVVTAISLTSGQTITVTYGAGGGAGRAVAPAAPETSTFTVKSKALDSGTLTAVASSPTVAVIDTTAPTVSLTAPTTGSTVHGSSVALTATASDNVQVDGVKYYLDGVSLGAEAATPFTTSFDSTGKSDGSHSVVAVARDSSSNYATSTAATITIDNTGPVISSIASTTAPTTATVTWTSNESSDSKVSYGTVSGAYTISTSSASLVTSHSIGLTSLSNLTTYYYVVVSADASGNISTSTEKTLQTTDITAPSVSLTSPSNGATLSGSSVSLAATASDNVAVQGVKFYIDGTLIGSEDTVSAYTGTLDSTGFTDGS